ncbi:unnamed protein product [Brachionus calyciflorus]|uniref:Uncharacterized protein n=1 Tax=Brachionus calyciflorus TaxID=104777 RepID=A0A813Y969_9BILA|nr:unnamed protein product [Brachionus calyciflorus]
MESASSCYRKVINKLITHPMEWATNTKIVLKETHKRVICCAYGEYVGSFRISNRPDLVEDENIKQISDVEIDESTIEINEEEPQYINHQDEATPKKKKLRI